MTFRITDNHFQRLEKMALARILPAIGEELESGARAIAEDTVATIHENGVPSPNHIVSQPGEPPNSDTGYLANSVATGDVIELPGSISTHVGVGADYGGYLENGTTKMEPRPYLGPATQRHRRDIIDAVGARYADEVNR